MRVLVVAHAFPPLSKGGAETYAAAHANALAAMGHEVGVLIREADPSRPDGVAREEQRGALRITWINNTFRENSTFAESYANPRVDAAAAQVIAAFRPDISHIHHLTGLSTGIVRALHDRRIPVIFTLHDYWLMCHRGQLLDTNYRVCAGPGDDGCASCLGAAAGLGASAFIASRALRAVEARLPDAPGRWLRRTAETAASTATVGGAHAGVEAKQRVDHMRGVMQLVTHFLSPSEFLRQKFIAFGVPENKITFWPNGLSTPDRLLDKDTFTGTGRAGESPTRPPDTDLLDESTFRGTGRAFAGTTRPQRLRLGFLGTLMHSKAPHVLLEAVTGLPDGAVTVDLFGQVATYHGDDSYRGRLASLAALPGVTMHGPIPHERVADALSAIDVLVVPSIWPENSPLVIGEALLAGVPLVASRVGGIPEMVIDGVNGLLVEPNDVESLRRAVDRVLHEPGLVDTLRAGARASPVRSLDDDVADAEKLYASLALPTNAPTRLAAVVLHYRHPDETRLAVLALLASRRPVDDLIVVDNDPECRALETLSDLLDRVSYLPSDKNLGYSGGMNLGIQEALARGASKVLVVNSDVIVPPNVIAGLESALDGDLRLGAVGPLVRSRSNPSVVDTAGMTYQSRTGRMRHPEFGTRADNVTPTGSPRPVDGLSGCAMLMTREAIERVGVFDEEYFFGFEDLDWCLRAKRAGLSVACDPRVAVYHEGSRAMGAESPRRLYYAARNHLRLAARSSPESNGLTHQARATSVVVLNVLHAFRERGGSVTARLGAVLRGTKDHVAGRYGDRAAVERP